MSPIMSTKMILLTIAGMALVTYIPRAAPMLALASRPLNPWLRRWLGFVPGAVLSALLLPGLLLDGRELNFQADNLFLWAAAPTLLVALKTGNFFIAVATGMGLVALARLVFGM